jgi:hypothetical protein
MDYATIRNGLVSELYQHLQVPVVPTDTTQPKPPYPFVSYKFTTLYRPDAPVMIRSPVPSSDPNFKDDVEYTLKEQPQMVLSISTYSDDEAGAYDLAIQVQDWFKLHGYRYLKENNLIVVNTTALQDRSILLIDNFEKRIGFDVTLRTVHEQKDRVESIEVYVLEG